MKKIYESPKAYVEMFTPNEYVAACGDSGKIYKFKCDAPRGTLYYYPTSDGNINGVYTGSGRASELGGYKPCNATHEAESTNPFYDGFVDRGRHPNGKCDPGEEVIVWLERGGWFGEITNWHATTKLNMSEWETAKS